MKLYAELIDNRGPALGYAVFQVFYEQELLHGHSPSSNSWIGSVQAFFLIASGVFVGPLFDHGYFMSTMSIGCFLLVFGEMMLSISDSYWQVFLSQAVCMGIGAGIVYVPGVGIISTTFEKGKTLALSVAVSGISMGTLRRLC